MIKLIEGATPVWMDSSRAGQRVVAVRVGGVRLEVEPVDSFRTPYFEVIRVMAPSGLEFTVVWTEEKEAVFLHLPRLNCKKGGSGEWLRLQRDSFGSVSKEVAEVECFWDRDALYFRFRCRRQPERVELMLSDDLFCQRIRSYSKEFPEKYFLLSAAQRDFSVPFGFGTWRVNFRLYFPGETLEFSPSFSPEPDVSCCGLLLFSPEL